jgi:hypothetical protein
MIHLTEAAQDPFLQPVQVTVESDKNCAQSIPSQALQLVEKRWKLNKLASVFMPYWRSWSWNTDLDSLRVVKTLIFNKSGILLTL